MRTLTVAAFVLGACVVMSADDPPQKPTPAERKELEARLNALSDDGFKAFEAGKYPDALEKFTPALDIARRLYPKDDFPNGHANLARSLRNLGFIYRVQGEYAKTEPLYREALDVTRRVHKGGDHANVTSRLKELAGLYRVLAKYDEAEGLARESLAMTRRLFKGDHPRVSSAMAFVASILQAQSQLVEAEKLYRDALAMNRRLYPKEDHFDVADNLLDLGLIDIELGKYADAETTLRDAIAMHGRLAGGDAPEVAVGMTQLAFSYTLQKKYADAEPLLRDALAMRRRLHKGDHPDTADCLHELSQLYRDQVRYTEAEAFARDALAMRKRVFPPDHPKVASSLHSVADILHSQGKTTGAEPLYRDSLAMWKRLHKGDHPNVAASLHDLAVVYEDQELYEDAESALRDALEMEKRLHPNQDCMEVSNAMYILAGVTSRVGKPAEAEALAERALEMTRRMYKGDHHELAFGMTTLAFQYAQHGKYAKAEPLYKDALAMLQRLYPGPDSHEVAAASSQLGFVYLRLGKPADALPLLQVSLSAHRRKVRAYASQKAEGEALTFLASRGRVLDTFLTAAAESHARPESVYPEVWASKGNVARLYDQRQQQARAAATDPGAAALLAELADSRRRRADLLLAPEPKDPATRTRREEDLKRLEARVADLSEQIRPRLPAVARAEKLAVSTPADLQKVLPADAAVVDYLLYTPAVHDGKTPGVAGELQTPHYLAFVLTRDAVARVELGPAGKIEAAVSQWREAITTAPFVAPADLPAKVRELVWEPVRRHLPADTRVAYVCPDADLTRVPWAALPGDKPGTILLEDFAVATIPHGPFLLDMLRPAEPRSNAPAGVLAVGGVAFGGEPEGGGVWAAARAARTRDGLAADPAKPLTWPDLPGAKAEAEQVARRATDRKLGARLLTGPAASAGAVLAALPNARYAHLATHGFFADAQFRSVLQVDPKLFRTARLGRERVGAGSLTPMVMSGLVLAGANVPSTPGRGVVTGEHLVDRDLSGLELAVLSACETGLGDVAGGEGVFGLQRAFHVAGTRNVVASLWKVPDAATAAVMGEFYRGVWDDGLPPVVALQKAQLAVYRADPKQFAEMARRGPGQGDANFDAAKVVAKTPLGKDGKNPAVVWAAFTLSGPGR